MLNSNQNLNYMNKQQHGASRPKPKRLTFAKLEAMAKKKGLAVYQVLDNIINAQLNQPQTS